MIANTTEMWRQGNRGVYDEALCMARPWGFPIDGVSVPVRIWHGTRDQVVPVGMGRFIERTVPGAVATYYHNEGHHFVYDRWREILAVIVAEATSRAIVRPSVVAEPAPADLQSASRGVGMGPREREMALADLRVLGEPAASA
jgi:hypothetical protein